MMELPPMKRVFTVASIQISGACIFRRVVELIPVDATRGTVLEVCADEQAVTVAAQCEHPTEVLIGQCMRGFDERRL